MISADEFRSRFAYESSTGVFTRRVACRTAPAGAVVGSVVKDGCGKTYLTIWINGKNVKAHRLAWLYMTGEFPAATVDHINGNGTDNRWENLRCVSKGENNKNKRLFRKNKSGVCGVAFHKRDHIWTASIRVKTRLIHLGTFVNKDDAIDARRRAERDYGFHDNHGSPRMELANS
jgi:uncharacterized protein YkuJ